MTDITSLDESGEELDFSTLLASSIHDMKNSLAMLLGSVSEVTHQCMPNNGCSSHKELIKIQHQGQRVNRYLIQLLILYRLEQQEYCLNVNEQYISDFFAEIMLENEELLALNGIKLSSNCDDMLAGYFDLELVRGVINTIINNAYQYSKDEIRLVAKQQDGYLMISVQDNGKGYPPKMLTETGGDDAGQRGVSFYSGSTGLGLYFSKKVAEIHLQGQRKGYIELSNDGIDGGGNFSIYLP